VIDERRVEMATIDGTRSHRDTGITANRLAYRPAELATMVGLSTKAIYRAVERGELEASKVANGTRLLIRADSAESWLVRNSVVPRAAQRPPASRSRRRPGQPLGAAMRRLSAPMSEE
jgi:excisionase family DNA binding protein